MSPLPAAMEPGLAYLIPCFFFAALFSGAVPEILFGRRVPRTGRTRLPGAAAVTVFYEDERR